MKNRWLINNYTTQIENMIKILTNCQKIMPVEIYPNIAWAYWACIQTQTCAQLLY